MKHTALSRIGMALTLTLAMTATAQTSLEPLRAGFRTPPADARPMVRWWWFGPAVTKPEIERELQQMRADGIGGVELAFVYPLALDDSSTGTQNLKFLSPPMLDMVRYAQTQGRSMGMRVDVTLCSGWPYGGPHITLALAATSLRTVEVAVPAGATEVAVPKAPTEGDTLFSASLADGAPRAWSSANATVLALPGASSPRVTVASSSRGRVALFFFVSHTRQQVKRAAVGAEGYVLDPFSADAVATHLKAVGEPLLSAFGSTPPYAIFSDSLEAYGADWTPRLPEEFRRRRGYDLLPHLPQIVAGDTLAAQKVRHDYGITLTELINENYLVQINNWAKAHNTRFRSQTYGEPAVSFSSQHLVDLAEGEGSQWRQFSTLRWATSANHVFGQNVTSGETFTWLHSPVFRATPLDMKAEADVDFLEGENELIFHGWPYSPSNNTIPAGDPGWSLYAAAALNDHNPWHPVMPAATGYIARMSYLLRQGQPANQVAVLLPTDDAWANFVPGKVSVTAAMMGKLITPELMNAILSAGYNVDFIDADAIRTAGLGTHQVVVLPPTDRIPVATLQALAQFVKTGGHVIAVDHLPTRDAEGAALANASAQTAPIVLVPSAQQLPHALHDAVAADLRMNAASPDAAGRLGFIRRTLPDGDIYFVANTGNAEIKTTLGFGTRFTGGERWDPDTGAVVGRTAATGVDLDLAPYESAVFVFSAAAPKPVAAEHSASAQTLANLSADWTVRFPAIAKTVSEAKLTDWMADPATQHFSGEAIYSRDFVLDQLPQGQVQLHIAGGAAVPGQPTTMPARSAMVATTDGLPNPLVTRPGPGMHAWFDPPVREAALVTINGQAAGPLWHPPYSLDVTSLLHKGKNHIEIRVFNTALNAWSAAPPRDYSKLIAAYGDRFQMQQLDEVRPLPSGLLGEILLTQH